MQPQDMRPAKWKRVWCAGLRCDVLQEEASTKSTWYQVSVAPHSPLSTRQVTHCGTFHKFFLERGWQLVCRMQMQLSETRATERQAGRGRQREAGRERQAERGRQREADSWLWECECSIDRSIVVAQLDFDQLCGPPVPGRTTPTPTQTATAASATAPSAAPSTSAASS